MKGMLDFMYRRWPAALPGSRSPTREAEEAAAVMVGDTGADEELHGAAVLVGGAGLAVVPHVLLEEPLVELLYGWGLAVHVPGGRWVAAAP